MKYIDADKLRAEIVRRITDNTFGAKLELMDILSFLDTLPDESEQPTRGYDEAYLNEKIAKASKSWEGVDVDKFMDEVRGREPVTTCNQFEEAAEAYSRQVSRGHNYRDLTCGFIAGAEWQKRKMMEGAVEGLICATITGTNAISFLSPLPKELTAGSEVRIIILPKEDE